MAELDEAIGAEQVKVVHLNDSKGEMGSHKDRHEHIGKGLIGLAGFWQILHDERWSLIPGILETPKSADLREDVNNLAVLRSLVDQTHPPEMG
jgi:deoxyribonuclease-4